MTDGRLPAWFNGALTVAALYEISVMISALWNHDHDAIFGSTIFLGLVAVFWGITLAATIGE